MSIARASLVMIAALIASRVLGWLRLSVFGAAFGETAQSTRLVAFRIPDASSTSSRRRADAEFIRVRRYSPRIARTRPALHLERHERPRRVYGPSPCCGSLPGSCDVHVSPAFASRPGHLDLTIGSTRILPPAALHGAVAARHRVCSRPGVCWRHRSAVYTRQILFAIFAGLSSASARSLRLVAGAAMMFRCLP